MLTVSSSEQTHTGLPRVELSSEVSRAANAACFGSEANFSIDIQVNTAQVRTRSAHRIDNSSCLSISLFITVKQARMVQ